MEEVGECEIVRPYYVYVGQAKARQDAETTGRKLGRSDLGKVEEIGKERGKRKSHSH